MNHERPIIGTSACLLGQSVRYDGADNHHEYCAEQLTQIAELRAFCPELEAGMGVPRPAVALHQIGEQLRVVMIDPPHIDVTNRLHAINQPQTDWLTQISGYIFKQHSPSCGPENVKRLDNGEWYRDGVGVFAGFVQQQFPLLPIIDEQALNDPEQREHFLQRVWIYRHWQQLNQQPLTVAGLLGFHSQQKLIIMSHNQNLMRSLGRLAANASRHTLNAVATEYIQQLMSGLQTPATAGNHINVLQHIQGYIKQQLSPAQKQQLSNLYQRYRLGQLPLSVPLNALNQYFQEHPNPFIQQSLYLQPRPWW